MSIKGSTMTLLFRHVIYNCTFFFLLLATPVESMGKTDNQTLNGKLIVGYQGWFECPGDGSSRGWVHWKNGNKLVVDMLPDTSELSPDEKCDSGIKSPSWKTLFLFSDQNQTTVARHFAWLQSYGIDGVALQKFASVIDKPDAEMAWSRVLTNVRKGAEQHGRVFFIMYDLSGADANQLRSVALDWKRLQGDGLTRSPSYLFHHDRPMLGLWGIGFSKTKYSPAEFNEFLDSLNEGASSKLLTVLGGVPTHWREGTGDADSDPAWNKVWPRLDVISPWTVGRFSNLAGIDDYYNQTLNSDRVETNNLGTKLMPVIFPGFSWIHLQSSENPFTKTKLDQIPRLGGAFFWRQAYNLRKADINMAYIAMFDEVNEGTAIFKVDDAAEYVIDGKGFVENRDERNLNQPDLYLRLSGRLAESLHRGEHLSEKP